MKLKKNLYDEIGKRTEYISNLLKSKHNDDISTLKESDNKLQEKISNLNQTLLESRKELIDASEKLNNLQQNPVPIGFIYVKLPNQAELKILWSTVEWKDVTSEYAGLFFRAEGGESAAFGKFQMDNAPRITHVENRINRSVPSMSSSKRIGYLNIGYWSSFFYTGDDVYLDRKSNYYFGEMGVSFYVSGGEVRPYNTAVRIWKRTN